MINSSYVKWCWGTVLVLLCAVAAGPVRAESMKICFKISAEFVDGGGSGKEDYFYHTSKEFYEARYTHIVVKKEGDDIDDALWNDFLDGDGCTGMMALDPATDYDVTWYTRVGTTQGRTIEIPKDGDVGCGYWCPDQENYYEYADLLRTPDSFGTLTDDVMLWDIEWESPRANLVVLGGWLMHRADELFFPANTSIVIKIDGDPERCDMAGLGGVYTRPSGDNICATSTNNGESDRHTMTDSAYYKFAVAHELGHGVQYSRGVASPDPRNQYSGSADEDGNWVDDTSLAPNDPSTSSAYCKCAHVDPDDGSRAHCFQSREWTREAMGEGYAHFFASALFNDRPADGQFNPRDCWFAYPKQGYDWFPIGNDVMFLAVDDTPPVFHMCANVKPGVKPEYPVTPFPWMDNLCNPGEEDDDEDVGVERDWLSFFWHLYADDLGAPDDKRFSIEDILATFGEGDGNYHFQKSLNAVEDRWAISDPVKRNNFRAYSTEQGVAHCEGGCNW